MQNAPSLKLGLYLKACRAKIVLQGLLFLLLGLIVNSTSANADVIILANRVSGPIRAKITPENGKTFPIEIAAGDVLSVPVDGPAAILFQRGRENKRYELDANCAYYFGFLPKVGVELQKIGLGSDTVSQRGRTLPGKVEDIGTISIVIAVDEEEATRRAIWEARIKKRIKKASAILEKQCRMRLHVVKTTTWDSDNKTTELFGSLVEFSKEVKPYPGRLVIGFTSQYRVPKKRSHLGGTRGPLFSHILIRESAKKIGEPERLEVLVHELGHYLGAVHSLEQDSVMRPILGDNRANRSDFPMKFDPLNALAINLVSEEIRRRGVRNMFELSPGTKLRLRQIYAVAAKAMPKDKAPVLYHKLLSIRLRKKTKRVPSKNIKKIPLN